jgi:hypothetical protein
MNNIKSLWDDIEDDIRKDDTDNLCFLMDEPSAPYEESETPFV